MFSHSHYLVCRSAGAAALAAALTLLSGCQAIANSTPRAQVRIIDVSPDAPGLDLYEGSNALAYHLDFGTLTSYIAFPPGPYTIAAKTTGTRQSLSSSKVILAASTQYTVLIGNPAASLQQLMLTDQSQPAPSGQVSLRFIDQATRLGPVDVYLVPPGQKLTALTPLLTGIVLNTNAGYLNIPAGTYTLVIVPSGIVPTSTTIATYTGIQVAYPAGAARTFILIDNLDRLDSQAITTPRLQVITADDYDSPPDAQ